MTASAWHDMLRIWNLTTVQRDARAIRFLTGFALLLLVALPIMGGISLYQDHTLPVLALLRVLLAIGGLWLAIAWVWLFVPSAVVMNSAANARLLPRQRRRLVQMAIGGWLLITTAFTVASGKWPIFALVGSYVLGFALMRAGNIRAVTLTVLPGFWPALSRHLLPEPLVQAISSGPGLLLATAAFSAAAAWALARLYPAAGDRHLETRGERVRRMERMASSGWGAAQESEGFLTTPGLKVYRAILRRDSRAPRADAMLMHAFGPTGHWSAWITTIVLLVVTSLVAWLFVAWRNDASTHEFVKGFSWGGLGGLAFMIAFSTAHMRQQLDRTRGEQALLLLTPLAGDRALLNRRLGTMMLRGALLQWIVLTAVVLWISTLFGGTDVVLREFALCCLGGQVAMACLFGDFAHAPRIGVVRAVLLGVLALVELGVAGGLGWLSGALLPHTWYWLIAISLVVGALQLRHGWSTLVTAPVAFPAGRLG
ncbi:hypothetical protein [Massilia sp. TN1-12]|uniref:hypothetical protein n=1 Tax=Massilia paldalensis TaxID=3377675 RepID=UPI00384D2CD9